MLTRTATIAIVLLHTVHFTSAATINLDTRYQTITGFGFSEAFGRSDDVQALEPNQKALTKVLDLLFSPTTGAGLNIVRNRIAEAGEGAIEPDSPGAPHAKPDYVPLVDSQVWFSQQAMKYGVSTFYLDAWTAPAYMKTDDNVAGGYLCGVTGETCASGDWRHAYANYLVKNVKDWNDQGVRVTHLGFLNEPEFNASYSSMLSNGTQAASFIPILRHAVNKAGLRDQVNLTCCDAEGWDYQEEMVAEIAAAGVEKDLDVITSHWYVTQGTSPIDTPLPVWQSEYADLGEFSPAWYYNSSFNEGLTWANLIYQGLHDANLSAFLHWEGAENSTSGSTLVSIQGDVSDPTITPSGTLWAFGQFARYVRPGAVRVEVGDAPSGLNMTAFHNTDGTVAVQLINGNAEKQTVAVGIGSATGFKTSSVDAYLTNEEHNEIVMVDVKFKNTEVHVKVPGRTMISLVFRG